MNERATRAFHDFKVASERMRHHNNAAASAYENMRHAIADARRAGMVVTEIAGEFGVSYDYVERALRSEGVEAHDSSAAVTKITDSKPGNRRGGRRRHQRKEAA